MRITRLSLDEHAGRPGLESREVAPGLNLLTTDSAAPREAVAGLLAQLLYGSAPVRAGAGCVDVLHAAGNVRLRRRPSGGGPPRLTISPLGANARRPPGHEQLLGPMPVEVLRQVFIAAGAPSEQTRRLLSEPVARAYQDLERQASTPPEDAPPREALNGAHDRESRAQLLAYRDRVAQQIEVCLAENRRRSGDVEREVRELESERRAVGEHREAVVQQKSMLESELAALDTRLRYQAIAETVGAESDRRDAAGVAPQIDELDQQIERWRDTLAQLELRETRVRNALAAVHPDDASPTLPLADQRAGLAVATRLLQDLEGEVARLARAADSRACVCRDAHPRLNPLVETLAKQIARLTDLAAHQERSLEVQQLKAEAEHLARSQAHLQQQLEHLLTRRQELWRSTRSKRGAAQELSPNADTPAPTRSRSQLQSELVDRSEELARLDDKLKTLERACREGYEARTRLLASRELQALQSELASVQETLRRAPVDASAGPEAQCAPRWRASELMARLTDGRQVALRLVHGGRELYVTDRHGVERPARELSVGEQTLAALALRLALARTAADHGVRLPLLLESPFTHLDPPEAVRAATVLDDFCLSGCQAIVVTERSEAVERARALGAAIVDLDAPPLVTERVSDPTSSPAPPPRRAQSQPREYLFSPHDDIERFPVPIRDRATVFARSRVRTIGDLLGADPSALAEELDRDDVTAELAALWQTHLALVCFVPRLTLDDAVALTSVAVLGPKELSESVPESLLVALEELRASDRGERLRRRGYRVNAETAARWVADAQRGLTVWQDTEVWAHWRRHHGERRERLEAAGAFVQPALAPAHTLRLRTDDESLPRREETSRRSEDGRSQRKNRRLRFHLELDSPVVDAPSIGPKTARRLGKLGVETVAELLDADPDVICDGFDSPRVTAEKVVAWQHQAELVCRVPELRGRDAQVLVACGFTRPEEIASMKPAELIEFVEPFVTSDEGQRVLRGGKAPDLAEVSHWIAHARKCRVLDAA